jgi:hypothetical protein
MDIETQDIEAATENRALRGDATRAPIQPCKRQAWSPTGSPPAQGLALPEQVQSEKSQGVRGTESPDSLDDKVNKTENYVSVFSGEVRSAKATTGWTRLVASKAHH